MQVVNSEYYGIPAVTWNSPIVQNLVYSNCQVVLFFSLNSGKPEQYHCPGSLGASI